MSGAAAAFYFYGHANDELRRAVELRFARHYPQLRIKIRSAAHVEGEGIELRGISVLEPGARGPRAELAYIDEMLLACQTTTYELLQHEPQITEVRVRRPILSATRRPDGGWSTSALLPFPAVCQDAPKVIVEGGTIELFDPLRNPTSTLIVRDIHLVVQPRPCRRGDPHPSPSHHVRGFMTGEHFQRIEFEGEISDGGRQWRLAGSADDVNLSPELHAALPGNVADQLAILKSLRASSQFRFTMSRDPRREPAVAFDLQGQLVRGRLEDPCIPYPLTDVTANVRCTNAGVHVSELRGRNGQMTAYVSEAWRQGYAANAPYFINAHCERLLVDRRLLDVLPDQWRARWYDFFLEGIVNAHAVIAYDGQVWKPDVQVECLDTSFTYHKFPYRLENGQGTIRLKDNRLDFWLTAYSSADQVSLKGNVHHLDEHPGLWCELHADRLTVDQKLLAALPEAPRQVIGSLHPYGRFGLTATVRRQHGENQPLEKQIRVALDRCSIKYDRFPYPVHNVSGTAELVGDVWEFRNLEGNNDTGEIRAHGKLAPIHGALELELHFAGANIALEDELCNALPINVQQLWNNVRPRGMLNARADVRYRTGDHQLQVTASVAPVEQTVSVEPRFLPYRIDGLQGEVSYQNGQIALGRRPAGQIKGRHQEVDIAFRGICELPKEGGWRVVLDDVAIDRLRADRDLQIALPHALNPWIRKFDPKDALNLSGRLEIAAGSQPGEPPHGQWDMTVALLGTNLNCTPPLTNLNGEAHVTGHFNGPRFVARAELDLDSLICRDVQVTRVTGPVRVDNEHILLGAWADKEEVGARPRPITGQAYGGWMLSDGWIKLEETPRYGLQLTAGDLDLARIGREIISGNQQLSGKLNGGVNLRGSAEGIHTLGGTGYLRIRDADLYRLPQMMTLLRILSFQPPDKGAFTNSEADFRIVGDHFYFDRISFSGDAITLRGQGEANFNTDLALTFYAAVGKDDIDIPLIPDLFRAASQQIMLIHVDGKLADPSIRRDPFPVVNQALGLHAGRHSPPTLGGNWLTPPSRDSAGTSTSSGKGLLGGLFTR